MTRLLDNIKVNIKIDRYLYSPGCCILELSRTKNKLYKNSFYQCGVNLRQI